MFDIYKNKYNKVSDDFDALQSMAVLSGFAELNAQAYYLGIFIKL